MDVNGSYDTRYFKSMGCVFVYFQRFKKDSAKSHSVKVNSGKTPADFATILLHEVKGIQEWLITI